MESTGAKDIFEYFPELDTGEKRDQMNALGALYRNWNAKINVISRKDIDHLYEHHVLHGLSIAKYIQFFPGSRILDLGTGGGFPGIPLAIYFPECRFHLIDGRRKKLKVVEAVAESIGLKNVKTEHIRAEECTGEYDFVVSRAVAGLDQLLAWSRPLISSRHLNAIPNGLIALKGGELKNEIKTLSPGEYVESTPLHKYFRNPYFEEKQIVYVQG